MSTSKEPPVGDGNASIHHWLALYHDDHSALDVKHYAAVPWWWLAAAYRALEDHPTIYPLAVVLGHLTSFLESKGRYGANLARNSTFTASNAQLALLGLDQGQVREGLKLLKAAGLVEFEDRPGRPRKISVLCGLEHLKRLKAGYRKLLDDGPASARRRNQRNQSAQGVGTKEVRADGSGGVGDDVEAPADVGRALSANGFKRQHVDGRDGFDTWVHARRKMTIRILVADDGAHVIVDGAEKDLVTGSFKGVRVTRAAGQSALVEPTPGERALCWSMTFRPSRFPTSFIEGLRMLAIKTTPPKAP